MRLGGLSVDDAWHGRGLASALVEEVEGWASTNGCTSVWVRSGSQRTDAHGFYRRQVYTDLKAQRVLTKTLPG
jgi:GNAT superfamily N-acetyltransferase